MKNVAIVIGASSYQRLTKLPGSKNDAHNIHEVLKLSDKFQDILYINEDKGSQEIKEAIIEFIEDNKSNDIDEMFMYFSGHGEFFNDDFHYLLTDFDEFKRNQTSIQNNFLDDLIRSIKPKNTIKVIDACQSGTQYIKDSGTIGKYFKDTKTQFTKCYFLFSSQQDQSSFQTKYISDFTDSFINALKNHTTSEIRYRNIIDYISDQFISNTEQKPFFVIQADNTEKFCSLNNDLKAYLKQYTGKNPTKSITKSETSASTLSSLIVKDAEQYCTQEEVLQIITSLKTQINGFKLTSELEPHFEYKIEFLDTYDKVTNMETIARYLSKNDNSYFVKIKYKSRTVEEPVRFSTLPSAQNYGLSSFGLASGSSFNHGIQTRMETKVTQVPIGYSFTFQPPFCCINIDIVPNLPNLSTYNAALTFVVSKKNIRFFSYLSIYNEQSWDSKYLGENVEWITEEFLLKDKSKLEEFIKSFNDKINSYITQNLKEKFEKKVIETKNNEPKPAKKTTPKK
jgi:hypothetical protein